MKPNFGKAFFIFDLIPLVQPAAVFDFGGGTSHGKLVRFVEKGCELNRRVGKVGS